MKKLKLFFACLLMAVLSIGQVWGADPVTIASSTFAGNTSSCATGWSCTGTGKSSGKYWCIGKNETITTPSITFSNYESISITVQARRVGTLSGSKATIVAKVGSTTLGSNDATTTSEKASYNIANNYDVSGLSTGSIVFTCSNATSAGSTHGAGIYSITITGVEKSTTPTCTNTVTITKADDPANGTFALDNSGTVCIDEGNATVNVTATPADHYHLASVTSTAGTIGSIEGNTCEITDIDADTEIGVTFAEDTKCVVTWNVNGNEDTKTNVYAGEKPVFPATPAACDATSTTFIGWATAPWTGKLADLSEKTVYTSASAMPDVDAAVTYYAVFAKSSGSASNLFSWAGGTKEELTAAEGVADLNADNSDYADTHAPYRVKWNGTGKYIIISVASQPGQVSAGFKMIGGGTTSTITVQEADDAEGPFTDVENLAISGSSNDVVNIESTQAFKSTTRAIKLYYTKGSNVGLGPISIEGAVSMSDYMTTCCTQYNVNIAAGIENGSVSADVAKACEGATITLTFTPAFNYHLSAWTLNGAAQDVNANTFSMPAGAATVSATFEQDNCDPLAEPVVTVSGKAYPYDAIKLAWTAIEHADAYKVYIYDNEDNELEHNDAFAGVEYTIGQTLNASTTYKYSVQAISNTPATYCPSTEAESTFTTDALPKAHLTLIALGDEHEDTGDYSILTPFNLPSTAASCAKTFMGWDADPDCATIPTYAKGAEFTFDNTTGVTLYAVYADETPGAATIKTDELDYEFTGLTGTSYKPWSDKTGTSGAVYAGQSCALGNNPQSTYIQLRTNNSNSGVVTTSTGAGNVTKVTVTWNSSQGADGSKLDVYGKNTAYSQATDLYGDNAGTLLGSIMKGTSTELVISGSYTYLGLRSNNGTVYLDEIDVQWTAQGESTYDNYSTECLENAETPTITPDGSADYYTTAQNVTITAEDGATIYYTTDGTTPTTGSTKYTEAISLSERGEYTIKAIAVKAGKANSDVAEALIKINLPFANLADLVAANLASGSEVIVSFADEVITDDQYISQGTKRAGLMLTTKAANNKAIEIFYNKGTTVVPAEWLIGGKLAANAKTFTWTFYNDQWELVPLGNEWTWDNGDLTYTAPKAVSSVVVSGAPTKTSYVDGEKFVPAGLTVTINYNDATSEVNPVGVTFACTPERVAKGATSVEVVATFNEIDSDPFEVTGLTVGDIQLKTIEEFIAAGNADMRCYLEGIVSDIETGTKLKYGNFNLTDASGTIYVYGCLNQAGEAQKFDELDIHNGDKIKVIAEDYDYYNSKHEAKNVQFVSKTSPVDITITSGSTVEKGKTLTLTATTDPAAAIDHISYSVKVDGNEGNVSLSDNVLTGVEVGEATIIASIPDGEGYIANSVEFTVEVTAAIVHGSITYVENGANEDIDDVADATALPDPLPTVTKDNFLFGGWYTDAEFNTPAVAGAALSEDVTLYAKWNAIPYWATVYTSNVEFTGQNSYESGGSKVVIAEVEYDAQKVGASSNQGQVIVTVPAKTHTLHFHVFTWKNKSNVISISGVTNPSATTFDVIGDNGGGASSPYTIEGNPIDHYYSVTFDAVTDVTDITFDFSSGGDKRFIMYGINQEGGVLPVLDHIVITGNASATEYEAGDVFSLVGLGVDAYYTLDNDPIEEPTHLDVDENWSGWSVSPAILTAETESVTVTATYEGKQANKNVNVNVTAPETPEIIASPAAINFGTVNQGAIVDAQGISVTLKAVAAATVTLAGDGAAAFSIDKAALSELNSTVTVTPVTTATGTFAATVTISDDADAADDVVINLSMTVEAVEDLSGTWVKATSVAAGDRIIIGATVAAGTKTMGGQNTNNRAAVASTYEDLVLTPTEGTKTLLVVDAGDGKFALQALNGKYLTSATSGTGNNLLEAANYENDNAKWTITIDGEGVASVVAAAGNRTYMKYNSGSTLFSCYQYSTSQTDINIYKKGTPDYGSYQRDVTSGNYGTICLPKAGVISGAKLLEIAYRGDNVIYCDEILTGEMEAGHPYIFQATSEQLNVIYTSGAQVAAGEANGLHGFYNLSNMATDAADKLDLEEDQGNYILYQNAYWLVKGREAYINNFRAYIKLGEISTTAPEPTPGQAPRRRVAMTVHSEQVATGMDNVQGDNVQCTKVLIDGQLFILRGEKMYDVKGQLVK